MSAPPKTDAPTICSRDEILNAEYRLYRGLDLLVTDVMGYRGDSDDFADLALEVPAVMRLVGHDPDHVIDEWADPYWDVELRRPHAEVDDLRSCWTYGPSHRDDHRYDAGELAVADTVRNRLLLWWRRLRHPELREITPLPLKRT